MVYTDSTAFTDTQWGSSKTNNTKRTLQRRVLSDREMSGNLVDRDKSGNLICGQGKSLSKEIAKK